MLLLETDPIAVAGLVVAIIGVLIAIPAAWGAVKAIKYAKDAPSKADLARVEGNTLRTSEHLEGMKEKLARIDQRQDALHEHDALVIRANNVPLTVRGSADVGKQIVFSISTTDPTVALSHVELLNEFGNKFGQANCEAIVEKTQGVYTFTIDADTLRSWINAGQPLGNLTQDKTVYLRVYMRFDGIESQVYRPITLTNYGNERRALVRPDGMVLPINVWRIEGNF